MNIDTHRAHIPQDTQLTARTLQDTTINFGKKFKRLDPGCGVQNHNPSARIQVNWIDYFGIIVTICTIRDWSGKEFDEYTGVHLERVVEYSAAVDRAVQIAQKFTQAVTAIGEKLEAP